MEKILTGKLNESFSSDFYNIKHYFPFVFPNKNTGGGGEKRREKRGREKKCGRRKQTGVEVIYKQTDRQTNK